MGFEDRKQHMELWGVAAIVTIAVLAGLAIKGFSGETIVDAIKDIGEVLIPILAAVFAARLVTREMDPGGCFIRAGEDALKAIQKRRPGLLSGPKPNTENYDSDNPGKAGRYLFFQKNHRGERSQLVPVLPFVDGVVEVRVSKATLKLLSISENLDTVSARVHDAVLKVAERDYPGMSQLLESKNERICIALDFDEEKLGPKGFRKAVECCAGAALDALVTKV